MQPSDEEIVGRIQREELDAFREIIRRYEEKLIFFAFRILGDRDMAEDAVQESFIKAFRNINSFDTKKKFFSGSSASLLIWFWSVQEISPSISICLIFSKPYLKIPKSIAKTRTAANKTVILKNSTGFLFMFFYKEDKFQEPAFWQHQG